jgi:hypothetical protein
MAPFAPQDHAPGSPRATLRSPARCARGWRAVRAWLAVGFEAVAAAACDGTPRALDAASAPSARTSALSVRIDVGPDQQPTLTALAFRASFSGVSASEVLGLVDPLSSPSPARDCQLRNIDSAAAALAAHGDGIELEELAGVDISAVDSGAAIRPSPRLYPDVAPAIGGVVSEAGPLALGAWPEQLHVTSGATADTASFDTRVSVPAAARVATINGAEPSAPAAAAVAGDLAVGLGPEAADATIELRPFGATVALICKVPALPANSGAPGSGVAGSVSFVVSHQLVAALVAATGAAPGRGVAASLDVVRRLGGDSVAAAETRIAVEVRASTLVELRP